jgi:4-hydroxy-4-methyl-2-oxoglutarate aldolase
MALASTLAAQETSFSSSDAADAAERLTLRRAHMSSGIRLLAGRRLEGPAVTLRLVRDDRASLVAEGLAAIEAVEEAPEGSVIVVCSDGDPDYAVFGATFATLARARGLGGFVVDGAMRGLTDLQRIDIPVFARAVSPGSAGGHYRLEAVNDTVSCAGVRIAPGDLVVGDADGVAIVPKAVIAEVRAKAQALRDEKVAMLALLRRYGSYTRAAAEYKRERSARDSSRMWPSPRH